ncbi:hypothetical protein R3P38DRAFT_2777171 [Favolaschia claudopus]|uniref:Uncharacterized protein n=1 Tax=Favolaschia claudopus TaxID=2862362 RepID=A0AAW0BLE1_9AGAR
MPPPMRLLLPILIRPSPHLTVTHNPFGHPDTSARTLQALSRGGWHQSRVQCIENSLSTRYWVKMGEKQHLIYGLPNLFGPPSWILRAQAGWSSNTRLSALQRPSVTHASVSHLLFPGSIFERCSSPPSPYYSLSKFQPTNQRVTRVGEVAYRHLRFNLKCTHHPTQLRYSSPASVYFFVRLDPPSHGCPWLGIEFCSDSMVEQGHGFISESAIRRLPGYNLILESIGSLVAPALCSCGVAVLLASATPRAILAASIVRST